MKRLFGTDGVRGIANVELDAVLAYQIGRATVHYLTGGSPNNARFAVARDTRLSGDMLEAALVSGICSTGAEAVLMGILPTPAVSYLTMKYGLDGGFMITASHNPYEYNGIKVFDREGIKLTDEMQDQIESLMRMATCGELNAAPAEIGKKHMLVEARDVYINHLKKVVNGTLDGLKIVLDCANGAAFQTAPSLLQELGAEILTIHNKPNGLNINLNCGSLHPERLQQLVVETGAHAGFAFDGDADRLIAVDEKGQVLSGDCIIAIFAKYMRRTGLLHQNTVVTTPMSNVGLDLAMEREKCQVIKVEVGDRYVLREMMKNGFNLGGERSGHVIFLDHARTSDGQLTALKLVEVIRSTGRSLSQLATVIREFPQTLINVTVKDENKHNYRIHHEIVEKIQQIEELLKGRGRLYIRLAGTEPMIRLLLEGENIEPAIHEAEDLKQLLESKLA